MREVQLNTQELNKMIGGYWISQGIYVAAQLGIADHLSGSPRTAEELAETTNTNSGALYRLLRALSSVGIFAQDGQGRFSLTPLAERLQSDAPGSQRSFAIMMGSELYEAWGKLLHSVNTGTPGFQDRFGKHFFRYMTENPERHSLYDAAMEGVHGPETEPMLDAYDFSAFRTVADIGGGNGQVLAAILKRHPELNGILFDLPAVVKRAGKMIADCGLASRCKMVGGDFFGSVPAGADAYLMRHIIHDWEDDDAVSILRNCRLAMEPGGVVQVVENVIPSGNEPSFGKWLDLMMLLVGGKERTEQQYASLFSAAGLKLNRVISTASSVSVIEGTRES